MMVMVERYEIIMRKVWFRRVGGLESARREATLTQTAMSAALKTNYTLGRMTIVILRRNDRHCDGMSE